MGVASLHGFELEFSKPTSTWSGHAASIWPVAGATTWGVLWDLPPGQWPALVASEGPGYEPCEVTVERDGIACRAWTFRAREARREPGAPSRRYLAVLLAGARAERLPARYIAHLATFATPKGAR